MNDFNFLKVPIKYKCCCCDDIECFDIKYEPIITNGLVTGQKEKYVLCYKCINEYKKEYDKLLDDLNLIYAEKNKYSTEYLILCRLQLDDNIELLNEKYKI